jgi:type I restriction enzyme R subunit
MSEHAFVEKPFLDQLAALNWQVVDQGPGVPADPAKSSRASFREIILEGVFRQSLHSINRTDQGQPWLTDKQIDDLIEPC